MARKAKLGLPLQTLRNAPDVQDGRRLRDGVAELEPDRIDFEGRFDDRLQLDVDGLKASIEANGQRVPILVRPLDGDRYSLIYGRRRLEACLELGIPIRAIVTETDGDQSLKDQLLENQERRDLSFIERALVAAALLEGDHFTEAERTARRVAEVLNLHEAGVSQLLGVVRGVGDDLIRAIGSAPGIGRPRWEELKKLLGEGTTDRRALIDAALSAREPGSDASEDRSDQAFLAVLKMAKGKGAGKRSGGQPDPMTLPGIGTASIQTNVQGKRLKIDLRAEDAAFVEWLNGNASEVIVGMHERWKASEG